MKKNRLAAITSHPIQYQSPLFKNLSKKIDLTVYFFWNFGVKETFNEEFGQKIKWDIPLLGGYKYKFLKNISLKPSSDFWGQINFGIIGELAKNRYDAILVFGWNSFTNWLAFLTAFIFGIPVMLRGENPLNQELLKSRWKINLKKIILGNLFKYISYFLYIGEENKKFYKFYGVPENKLVFVPYAIDNDRFMTASELLKKNRNELRKDIGINENDNVILFVGKLIEKKRPMDLLKAYEIMVNGQMSNVKCHLLFVGDGVLRKELENYCEKNNLKNVHFVGFKNQTELPEYYVISDVLVLPSGEGETWGLVVNEAMCFGLPIIVSNRVGCGPDLIKNGENGYIFSFGDVSELAQKIKVIFDKDKMEKFKIKSLEIVKNYDFKNDIKGIIKIFKST